MRLFHVTIILIYTLFSNVIKSIDHQPPTCRLHRIFKDLREFQMTCKDEQPFDLTKEMAAAKSRAIDYQGEEVLMFINSSAITEIAANQFDKNTFAVSLFCPRLQRIHSQAFKNLPKLTTVQISGDNQIDLSSDRLLYDFFDALNHPTITDIYFDVYRLDRIPPLAVGPNVSRFSIIGPTYFPNHNQHRIHIIDQMAFAGIRPELQSGNGILISLSYLRIKIIEDRAFRIRGDTNEMYKKGFRPYLIIWLQGNLLLSESFGVDAFSTNLPTTLYLDENRITYLKEEVFRPLVADSDDVYRPLRRIRKISVFDNPIDCDDCRNRWMMEFTTFRPTWAFTRVIMGICSDGTPLDFLKPERFSHCD